MKKYFIELSEEFRRNRNKLSTDRSFLKLDIAFKL